MERTVYIIKPEATTEREKIRRLIEADGLRIVEKKLVMLDENSIDSLYPDLSAELRAATVHYFSRGPSEIGVVEGTDAMLRLCRLGGDSVNPAECGPSTIRRNFGSAIPIRSADSVYYLNGFHRSRSVSEVEHDLALFRSLPAIFGS